MPRIRSRRSAPAAPIQAWKTPRTSPGNSIACCAGRRRKRCSRATTPSAVRRRTRTSANSTRSTDFMAPVSQQEARLRKAVLSLAKETEFGKRMVNGGRLSVPSIYDTPLSTADRDTWRGGPRPGASMPDAPIAAANGQPMFLTEAFIRQGNAVHAAGVWQWCGDRRAGRRGNHPHRRRRRLCRCQGSCRRALRCRTRHRLSAAARRLCRRALPASDTSGAGCGAVARRRSQLRVCHDAVDQHRISQSPTTPSAPSSRRIAA